MSQVKDSAELNETLAGLSHLDAQGRPAMVDVSGQEITGRAASAKALVTFPAGVTIFGQDFEAPAGEKRETSESTGSLMAAPVSEVMSAKGPVFATAIIAGTQAAKATSQLIPFCHAVALEDCKISCVMVSPSVITITCAVKSCGRTGVEMEALTLVDMINQHIIPSVKSAGVGPLAELQTSDKKLKAGVNRILIKVCQNEQKEAWAQRYIFQARVCDSTGKAISLK
jgi:cyclic pyranopterin phosphate synthase